MQQIATLMQKPLSIPITPRLYQETISAKATKENTLVVLPTGLGKTIVSLLVAINRLKKYPDSKILILAPTKPLVAQHLKSFQGILGDQFDPEEMVLFTGAVSPEKRKVMFEDARFIFSTPQGLENDILASRIRLKDISLIVFDEGHRATGEYSYVWVAEQYMKQALHPLILGLTASPGTDKETVREVCENLCISQIEYRDHTSPDVKPYVKETKLMYSEVDLPDEFMSIHKMLQRSYLDKLAELKRAGFFQTKTPSQIRKLELLQFCAQLRGRMSKEAFDPDVARGISVGAQALKISHAVELCETQGIPSLHEYLKGMFKDAQAGKSKAVVSLSQDPLVRAAYARTKELALDETTHPKMIKLCDIVQKHMKPDAKIIVFSQFRDTLTSIKDTLNEQESVVAEMFVGQAKKKSTGMSQKKQLEMIQRFKDNEFNVLCMSSVGEEGLDIPAVDLVVFYEPIPSAIRTIQRRGRTGRQEEGRVIVLVTRGTRDVAYRWVAQRKEQNMYGVLEDVKRELEKAETKKASVTLSDFTSEKVVSTPVSVESRSQSSADSHQPAEEQQHSRPIDTDDKLFRIIADSREKHSKVLRTLHSMDVDLELTTLQVGDYCLGEDVAVEYKKVDDFVNSIVDGRLLEQVKQLKSAVLKPMIVVEGEESLFTQRNIHPNSIYGMLTTITLSYGVPILFTRNEHDTANLLFMICRREQDASGKKHFNMHASNKPRSEKEQLEYMVSSIPGLGQAMAVKLLEKFGSVQDLAMASSAELCKLEGVGQTTADAIVSFFEKDYRKL